MSSSVQAVVSSNKSRIPPHQRGQELSSRLPAQLLRHILKFLPLREFMISQKTCKGFMWNIVDWTKQRNIFEAGSLFKFFHNKRGLSEDASIEEMRKIGGIDFVDLCGLRSTNLNPAQLNRLLDGENNGILSRVKMLALCHDVTGQDALTKTPLLGLTDLMLCGYDSGFPTKLLSACPSLTNLHVTGSICNEVELSKMCPSLRNLSVGECGSSLDSLRGYAQLTDISIGGIGEDGYEALKDFPALSSVTVKELFDGTCFTNAHLDQLVQIPHLSRLVIARHAMHYQKGMDNFGILARAAELSALELHGMDAQSRLSLIRTIPAQITDLTFLNCGLEDQDFAAIAGCTRLRRLAIRSRQDGGRYTDQGIAHLQSCRALVSLEFLHSSNGSFIQGGAAFTTRGMIDLVRELPVLQRLDLSECRLEALKTEEVEAAVLPARPGLHLIHKLYWTK